MGKCIVSISNKMKCYTVYLYLETALHVSGGTSNHHQEGAHTTVSTASDICHTVTAICRYRGNCGWRMPPTAHSNRFQLFHDSGR
jgi:hypothetical protein